MAETSTDSRKAKITPEHREEARRLKALWEERDHETQTVFGEKYEIGNQSAVRQFMNAETPLSMKAAAGFAKGLRCNIGDFSKRLAAQVEKVSASLNPYLEAFSFVPQAEVMVSAGHGSVVLDEGLHSSLAFRKEYLQAHDVAERNAVVVKVKGHSMEPSIDDGSVLLVNRAYRTVTNGLVYAFRLDDELFVKRMFKKGESLTAKSDNPDREKYQDVSISVKSGDFEMIGRAIWMGKKL